MPVVFVGKEFFTKELRAYPIPALAFWRENFTNAFDAGATKVEVWVSELVDGSYSVVFRDDGCGMTREVLENVFFALGRSTKDENSSGTGGFGRARIITLFAHESYTILTKDLFVQGSGAEYEIQDGFSYVNRTEFTVKISNQVLARDHLMRMFQYFLDECDELPATVHLNDKPVIWKPVKGTWIRDLEHRGVKFARVSYAKDVPYGNKAVVRVNGVAMFNRSLEVPGWVIIDLIPETSRKVMTSNRDGFNSGYQDVFTRLMNELASEKRTALKPKPPQTFQIFEGGGLFATNPPTRYERTPDGVSRPIRDAGTQSARSGPVRKPSDFAAIVARENRAIEEAVDRLQSTGFGAESLSEHLGQPTTKWTLNSSGHKVYQAADFLPDIPLLFEHTDQKILERSRDFNPTNWKFRIVGGQALWGDHGDIVRLYFAAKLIAEKAIQQLVNEDKLPFANWTIGWIFSDDKAGMLMEVPRGHAILINPVKPNGILRYKMPFKQDIVALAATVLHEVTHMVTEYHDEDFANVQTDLYAAVNPWSLETEIKAL